MIAPAIEIHGAAALGVLFDVLDRPARVLIADEGGDGWPHPTDPDEQVKPDEEPIDEEEGGEA